MKKKQHPITYEHIGYLLLISLVLFIVFSAFLFWIKKTVEPYKDIWHCFSTDGRINYVIVQSEKEPSYLPVSGNEKVDYYCNKKEVIILTPQ